MTPQADLGTRCLSPRSILRKDIVDFQSSGSNKLTLASEACFDFLMD